MYYLISNAEKIEKKPSSTKFTITRVDKYEILEIKENAFSLKLNSSIFIDPEALFRVNLEHQIKYEFTHEIDTKFIENNLEEIFHPVGSEVSYITSTLTKFLTDSISFCHLQ
jgi:hypothetical protein